MPTETAITLNATLEHATSGAYQQQYIMPCALDPHTLWNLPKGPVYVLVEMGGKTFARALVADGLGGWFLSVSKDVMNQAGLKVGGTHSITLRPNPTPAAIELPAELEAALDQFENARPRFEALSPSRKRNIAKWAADPKKPETRVARAIKLADALERNVLNAIFNPSDRK